MKAEWYKEDPFILSTQAQQVFYTEDRLNGPAWKVVQPYSNKNKWDMLEDIVEYTNSGRNTIEILQESTSGSVELAVEVPNFESITYHRLEVASKVIVDEEVISLIETDEDLEVDDTMVEYFDEEDAKESEE